MLPARGRFQVNRFPCYQQYSLRRARNQPQSVGSHPTAGVSPQRHRTQPGFKTEHLDYAEIGRALASIPGVRDVHDLHVWAMGADEVALSAHMGVESGEAWPVVLGSCQRRMRERFGIRHLTLQPDWPRKPPSMGRRVIPMVARGDDGPD